MNLTITDTLQTTGGPLAPLSLFDDDRRVYALTHEYEMAALCFKPNQVPLHQFMHSVLQIELTATYPDGAPVYVHLPWDYYVLLADGDELVGHELCTGDKIAYFTRIMRHEKYSAMRVTPFMKQRHLEHRWVWEQHSGMDIPDTHSVDHIDNDSYHNHYSNLRSISIRSHSKMTAYRQRNRHTRRNADGSFAKGSTTTRIASADKPIPMHLSTGSLTNTCRVVSLKEVTVEKNFYTLEVDNPHDAYVVMGNVLVRP